ncbi:PREDICTED: prefoldin subunit 5-like [Priapulus caudatus]|uniref:Prefoldin subunit 5-like n=1 Tax=Priapulus caudatus TaxID=37621 RepID=A0ABM1FBP8_PRICU|nr:PREDICTED: prefoldin subunit 5-like [Priapulus caudatus]
MASPKQVDISQLQVPQLEMLRQQLDQEIELFSTSLQQLKIAQQKFVESEQSLVRMTPDTDGSEILVPLTSSMYVPGKLSDISNVLIDIGTGYYVEMDVNNGKEYFKRKTDYVTKNLEKVQPMLQEKYKLKQVTMEVLQTKIQAQLATKQAAAKT